MAGVTEEEVNAIAEHEHLPSMVALELGYYLLNTPEGVTKLREFLVDDIATAQDKDDCGKCIGFSQALTKFLANHSEVRESDPEKAQQLKGLSSFGQADELAADLKEPNLVLQRLLKEIEDAKHRHDCCDCEKSCLKLIRALKSETDQADRPE
jgi:hypothetical protein